MMRVTATATDAVRSDGVTVWVDTVAGFTVGRFSRFGIDVHTADASGCIDCTHTKPGPREWVRFQNGMAAHHGIDVGEEHRPHWLDTDTTDRIAT
jgi:hypothetical protein